MTVLAPPTASERPMDDYSWSMVFDAATRTRYSRLTCPGCGRHDDVRTGYNLPAPMIREKFEHIGWIVDIHHIRKCKCPDCQKRKPAMVDKSPIVNLQQPAPKPESTETLPPLTPAQRAKIREKLDSYFDDTRGYYLEGYSDERIARDLGVPRKHVEDIRILAYGELKAPPEMIQLRRDLNTAAQHGRDLLDEMNRLMKRLDELERTHGVTTRTA